VDNQLPSVDDNNANEDKWARRVDQSHGLMSTRGFGHCLSQATVINERDRRELYSEFATNSPAATF
jgi:hypothetical protein